MERTDEPYTIGDAIWQRDVASAADRVGPGDEFSVEMFDQWTPADWRDFATRLAAEKMRAIQSDEPGVVLIIEADADRWPSLVLIGPHDDRATGARLVEDVCADCEADGREVRLVVQIIGERATLLCDRCERRARGVTHEQMHNLFRSGVAICHPHYRGSVESNGVRTHQHECPECHTMLAFESPAGTWGYLMAGSEWFRREAKEERRDGSS